MRRGAQRYAAPATFDSSKRCWALPTDIALSFLTSDTPGSSLAITRQWMSECMCLAPCRTVSTIKADRESSNDSPAERFSSRKDERKRARAEEVDSARPAASDAGEDLGRREKRAADTDVDIRASLTSPSQRARLSDTCGPREGPVRQRRVDSPERGTAASEQGTRSDQQRSRQSSREHASSVISSVSTVHSTVHSGGWQVAATATADLGRSLTS